MKMQNINEAGNLTLYAVRDDADVNWKKIKNVDSFKSAEKLVDKMDYDNKWPEGYEAVVIDGKGQEWQLGEIGQNDWSKA